MINNREDTINGRSELIRDRDTPKGRHGLIFRRLHILIDKSAMDSKFHLLTILDNLSPQNQSLWYNKLNKYDAQTRVQRELKIQPLAILSSTSHISCIIRGFRDELEDYELWVHILL